VLKQRTINSTLYCPLLCCIEVPALVLYVEVRMGLVMVVDPIICNESHVGVAHEFLAQQVCAVIYTLCEKTDLSTSMT